MVRVRGAGTGAAKGKGRHHTSPKGRERNGIMDLAKRDELIAFVICCAIFYGCIVIGFWMTVAR